MDRSERIGLGFSAAGHGALLAALSLGLLHWTTSKPIRPPAIEVSLADDVALESRTMTQADPQSAQAPELGEPVPDAAEPQSQPVAEPEPAPVPRAVAPPQPQPKPRPAERARPEPVKAPPPPAKNTPAKSEPARTATPAKTTPSTRTAEKPAPRRGPRLGDDFLKGLDAPATQKPSTAPGAAQAPIGPAAVRALNAEITRQIKPYWKAPTGADADQLVTIVAVTLGPDGAIQSGPRVVRQTGVTASNSGQRQLHAENAVRAVRLAAPFKLPADLYEAWQSLELNFDKRLNR